MLNLAILFLVIAVVAALFGFSGIAEDLSSIAWLLVVIFAVLFVIAAVMNFLGGRRTTAP